jgi:hypothetical protein
VSYFYTVDLNIVLDLSLGLQVDLSFVFPNIIFHLSSVCHMFTHPPRSDHPSMFGDEYKLLSLYYFEKRTEHGYVNKVPIEISLLMLCTRFGYSDRNL